MSYKRKPQHVAKIPSKSGKVEVKRWNKKNIILAIIATISAMNGSGNTAVNCAGGTAVATKWSATIATR